MSHRWGRALSRSALEGSDYYAAMNLAPREFVGTPERRSDGSQCEREGCDARPAKTDGGLRLKLNYNITNMASIKD